MPKKPSATTKTKYENELNDWVALEKAAIEIITLLTVLALPCRWKRTVCSLSPVSIP